MLVLMLVLAGIATDADARLTLALAADDPPAVVRDDPPPVAGFKPKQPPVNVYTYETGSRLAVKQRKPLVIFLGIGSTRPVSGAIVCQEDYYLKGFSSESYPGIIIAVPRGDWLDWKATLPATATDAEIQRAIAGPARKAVQASPVPFPEASERRVADGEIEGRGPWPNGLEFPVGMIRYRRAKNTQSIVVLNGRDSITPVPRTQLDPHWQVSGEMSGLNGWRSDVYRNDAVPRRWIGDIHVRNRFGFLQPNRGYLRSYPDGAKFMDVLSTDGTVFEVRQRTKVSGAWESSVLYEDQAARPAGYNGKTVRTCASCHSESGSGEYGAGLVPGGDGVISDPFVELER